MARWLARQIEPSSVIVQQLIRQVGVSPQVARLLAARGQDQAAAAKSFLQPRLNELPDPFLMAGMEVAVRRLHRALLAGERISIHGDYDVDGITGAALLMEVLGKLGARVDFHIPLRLEDGYGLSARALEASAAVGTRLVISVDCGISALAEAQLARQLGLDLIITDHHQPPASLPPAEAILNPHLPDCAFPCKDLAGVGVAFFLMAGLRKHLRDSGYFAGSNEPDLREVLDLVALGTIADLAPLRGVNRNLVSAGLTLLQHSGRPGIQALKDVAGVSEVTCGVVGFQLAPRLNAAGRLEDAARGVDLLLNPDPEPCREAAVFLDQCNRQRRELENATFQEAVTQIEAGAAETRHVLVLAGASWHPGVIGIVASRLVEKYHRPTVLVAWDGEAGKGSARSIEGFHLFEALERCGDWLEGFGGHAFAAGLTIHPDRLAGFSDALEQVARNALSSEDLVAVHRFDGEVELEELNLELAGELTRLSPFGIGNPEPVWLARKVKPLRIQPVGNGHLRFQAQQGGYSHPCIAFGLADRLEELSGEVDLLFSCGINSWKGRDEVQLRIRDIRPAQEAPGG